MADYANSTLSTTTTSTTAPSASCLVSLCPRSENDSLCVCALLLRLSAPSTDRYLRLKSFQRFTETWALLERCAAAGLFAPRSEGGIFAPTAAEDLAKGARPLRVCSLGGGPGYELLAYDWFARYWMQVGGKTKLLSWPSGGSAFVW